MTSPLIFNLSIARQKPSNKDACPFCAREDLDNILDQTDDFIWLENKYPTIESSFQTVLVESQEHLGDLPTYSYAYNRKLFRYTIDKWLEVMNRKTYRSVVLFKNFGTLSGGSLRHPHMQIVGFEQADAYQDITFEHFQGLEVLKEDHLTVTLSEKPLKGFCEFNVLVEEGANLDSLADKVKEIVTYMLEDFHGGICDSYNLFFYRLEGQLICKVVPRFVVSPYFVGYHLPQVNDRTRLLEVKEELLPYLNQNRES